MFFFDKCSFKPWEPVWSIFYLSWENRLINARLGFTTNSDWPAGLFDEGDGNHDSLSEEDEEQDDDELHNSQDDHCKTAKALD